MGVDTKILLTSAPDVLDILKFVDTTYKNASLKPFGGGVNAYFLSFRDRNDQRHMAVFPAGECQDDYKDVCSNPAVYMSLGCWGNSEVIARRLAIHFGGMIIPNDSKDDWQSV